MTTVTKIAGNKRPRLCVTTCGWYLSTRDGMHLGTLSAGS